METEDKPRSGINAERIGTLVRLPNSLYRRFHDFCVRTGRGKCSTMIIALSRYLDAEDGKVRSKREAVG
jgi:hypothetical protein